MLVSCKQCNIQFNKLPSEIRKTNNNFCSRSCSATFNNVGKCKNNPKVRTCKRCNTSFYRSANHKSTMLCASCFKIYKNKTNYYKSCSLGQYRIMPSIKNKHPSWIHAHVRNFARSWNKSLTKLPCQKCGYSIHVELCHIIPISSWSDEATLGMINHPDNIISLCRNHHWELDNGYLKLNDIPKR